MSYHTEQLRDDPEPDEDNFQADGVDHWRRVQERQQRRKTEVPPQECRTQLILHPKTTRASYPVNSLGGMPPEILIKIFTLLHPVDATCLSIVNHSMYDIGMPWPRPKLTIGSPLSAEPKVKIQGCRMCWPVLYYPAHCELWHHLRDSIPPYLKYCRNCEKFTYSEDTTRWSEGHKVCGMCFVSYNKKARSMLDVNRPGETPAKLRQFFTSASV